MYICSARNIYIYLCPQIYGVAHTPCYLLPIRPPQFCYDEAKIGKILNFYSASRQGGGQSRRPSKGQIPVCAASGANTLQGG